MTCCTELAGGFGFSRNWLSTSADTIWVQTAEVGEELRRRRYPPERIALLGPLLYPAYHRSPQSLLPPQPPGGSPAAELPLLVLGAGANGANNHCRLLEALRPFAGRLAVVALAGRRQAAFDQVTAWAEAHPDLAVQALGFQGPEQMAALYRGAWAMVARPGARGLGWGSWAGTYPATASGQPRPMFDLVFWG